MIAEIIGFVIICLLTAASGAGIIISIIKLRGIKNGIQGKRTPWIIILVVCSIYMALFIAAIIFLFMIMVSITVNGM